MNTNGRMRICRRVLLGTLAVAAILFGSLVGIGAYQRWTLAANIRKLQVGDSKERVTDLLGEPRERFKKGGQIIDVARKQSLLLSLLMPESPETWVYGSWSLLRLGVSDRDYAIEFDDQGCIARVRLPKEPEK